MTPEERARAEKILNTIEACYSGVTTKCDCLEVVHDALLKERGRLLESVLELPSFAKETFGGWTEEPYDEMVHQEGCAGDWLRRDDVLEVFKG